MADIKISDMMQMQRDLWEAHKDTWSPLEPEYGRDSILFMIEEIGECVAILKKKGDDAAANDPEIKSRFVEEMSDVLMYYTDVLLRYGVTAEEISEAYINKHNKNMGRNYTKEYQEMHI